MKTSKCQFKLERLPTGIQANNFTTQLGCVDLSYIDVTPQLWSAPQVCLNNVCTTMQMLGGEGRLGYLLWEIWGGLCLSAEPHCIWFADDQYREITPQYGRKKVCFAWTGESLQSFEDFEAAHNLLLNRKAKTKLLVEHPLVERAVSLMTEIAE